MRLEGAIFTQRAGRHGTLTMSAGILFLVAAFVYPRQTRSFYPQSRCIQRLRIERSSLLSEDYDITDDGLH